MNILRTYSHLLALGVCLAVQGCAAQQEAIRGTLLDAKSETPLSGAYVILQWNGRVAHFPAAFDKCLHTKIIKTDSSGTLDFQPWAIDSSVVDGSIRTRWSVILPGYEIQSIDFKKSSNGKYYLRNYSGTDEYWIVTLIDAIGKIGCGEGGEEARAELAFYDDLLREVEAIPSGTAPINFMGTMVKAGNIIHDKKCLVSWQDTGSTYQEKRNARVAYDQCLNRP